MIKEHPAFQQPDNTGLKLWRYMNLAKFIAILQSTSLYFSRSDYLGDPFEGSSSKANIQFYEILAGNEDNLRKHYPNMDLPSFKKMTSQMSDARRIFLKEMFVSCWHASDYESAAMWAIYTQDDQSVAIQTTYDVLAHELPENVFLGMVEYIDYDTDFIPEDNLFNPFMRKRKSFEHEREARAIVWGSSDYVKNSDAIGRLKIEESGAHVLIDLNVVIQNIYVSPTAPHWFSGLVKDVTHRYDVNCPVIHSSLGSSPVY